MWKYYPKISLQNEYIIWNKYYLPATIKLLLIFWILLFQSFVFLINNIIYFIIIEFIVFVYVGIYFCFFRNIRDIWKFMPCVKLCESCEMAPNSNEWQLCRYTIEKHKYIEAQAKLTNYNCFLQHFVQNFNDYFNFASVVTGILYIYIHYWMLCR